MKDLLSKLLETLESDIIHGDVEYNGISIDSRNLKNGNLFIAIKGDNFDGHDFISDALDNGASGIITEKYFKGVPQIVVKNSIEALGFIAKYHKDKLETYRAGTKIGPNSDLMIMMAMPLSDVEIANLAAYLNAQK